MYKNIYMYNIHTIYGHINMAEIHIMVKAMKGAGLRGQDKDLNGICNVSFC